MRNLLHALYDLWCLTTGRCRRPVFRLDDLKRDDPDFAEHMEWMQEKQAVASIHRKSRQRQNPLEPLYTPRHGGPRHE